MILSNCHRELTNGVGKCSVPMWQYPGIPAGFCNRPAYSERLKKRYYRYDGYVPALACPAHGGHEKNEILNLCIFCENEIPECESKPAFGCETGNDNVFSCNAYKETNK